MIETSVKSHLRSSVCNPEGRGFEFLTVYKVLQDFIPVGDKFYLRVWLGFIDEKGCFDEVSGDGILAEDWAFLRDLLAEIYNSGERLNQGDRIGYDGGGYDFVHKLTWSKEDGKLVLELQMVQNPKL